MTTNGFPDWNINGLIPIGNNTTDDYGSLWWVDGEVGGWDSPDMRMTMLPRIGSGPGSDGEYAGDLHYRGRSMTMTLYCAANSEENRENSRLLLARALDLTAANGQLGIFYVNEVVPKQCYIQRAGNTNQGKLTMTGQGLSVQASGTPDWVQSQGQVYLFSAVVEMFASDPRKYSQSTTDVAFDTTTGIAAITPVGNTQSQNMLLHCVYSASPGAGPIVLNYAGINMRLLVPTVPVGGPLLNPIPAEFYVDFYSKLIYDAGMVNYYYLRDLQTPWLVMPASTLPTPTPGDFTITPAPDVSADLSYYDAWI